MRAPTAEDRQGAYPPAVRSATRFGMGSRVVRTIQLGKAPGSTHRATRGATRVLRGAWWLHPRPAEAMVVPTDARTDEGSLDERDGSHAADVEDRSPSSPG